ncbi:MAG: hypothetical protein GC168_14925 [Candidatus Hydrogenedens sp.]|nr:hypothetical protein [Candidatus Hydrogenedens sp.]
MPPKKKTDKTKEEAAAASPEAAEPMVTMLKTSTAPKLSPRGDGQLTYQIGRMDDTVLLRISGNESSGRFSKEWVTAEAIRRSLVQLPKGTKSFKGALALKTAWKGQSSCNSGFGAAILKAEGVFAADEDPKKKGMLQLAAPDALDTWEQAVLAMKVPKDAEQVPLHPPKPKPFFAKKGKGEDDAVAAEPVEPVDDTAAEESPEESEAGA